MALRMVPRAAPVPRAAARAPTQRGALRGTPLRHAAMPPLPRFTHRAPAASPRAELLPLAPRANPLLTARDPNGAPLAVLDTEGRSVPFAELMAGKTVVSFIRHFGARLQMCIHAGLRGAECAAAARRLRHAARCVWRWQPRVELLVAAAAVDEADARRAQDDPSAGKLRRPCSPARPNWTLQASAWRL